MKNIEVSIAGNWFNKYKDIYKYDMAESYVEAFSLKEILDMAGDAQSKLDMLCNLKIEYGERLGLKALRRNIASLYETMNEDNIITTHGCAGANQLAFTTLYEKGDRVVSIVPTYQQLRTFPSLLGADLQKYQLVPENDFCIDYCELKRIVTKNTKLICLTNPNNPTGKLFGREDLAKIADIAKTADCYVLCDEIYNGTEINENKRQVSIVDIYEKGISTCSMSKTFSLPGLRLGWIACSKELVNRIADIRHYYTMEMGIIDEVISTIAIENKDKIIKRNKDIIKENTRLIDNWVNREKRLCYRRPDAGSVALIKYDFNISSVEFCEKLINAKNIMLMPGEAFGLDKHFRIGLVTKPEITKIGLDEISDFMETLS